jgi:hypothetical protein
MRMSIGKLSGKLSDRHPYSTNDYADDYGCSCRVVCRSGGAGLGACMACNGVQFCNGICGNCRIMIIFHIIFCLTCHILVCMFIDPEAGFIARSPVRRIPALGMGIAGSCDCVTHPLGRHLSSAHPDISSIMQLYTCFSVRKFLRI